MSGSEERRSQYQKTVNLIHTGDSMRIYLFFPSEILYQMVSTYTAVFWSVLAALLAVGMNAALIYPKACSYIADRDPALEPVFHLSCFWVMTEYSNLNAACCLSCDAPHADAYNRWAVDLVMLLLSLACTMAEF